MISNGLLELDGIQNATGTLNLDLPAGEKTVITLPVGLAEDLYAWRICDTDSSSERSDRVGRSRL